MLRHQSVGRLVVQGSRIGYRKYAHAASDAAVDPLNAVIDSSSPPSAINPHGVLRGRTIAIKDNIVTSDLHTTAASKTLYGFTSPFDATVVDLLRKEGAVISAKANLDEFGMGSHSQNSHAGAVHNYISRTGQPLSPGGSSGGSAVAVATKQFWAALGTDTGGSVRLPAAYTGIVGFKPSYGLLSRWGVIQYANSLDTVGILARTVGDVQTVFGVVNKYDARDPTSLSATVRARLAQSEASKKKSLRIGIPVEYNIAELSPVVRSVYERVLKSLRSAGHSLHKVSLPSTRTALSTYYVLAPAEASSNLAKYDGIRYGFCSADRDASDRENLPLYSRTRAEGFGDEVKRRILLGAYTLSSTAMDNYFIQAQKVRRLVQRDFDRVFADPNPLVDSGDTEMLYDDVVDVLLTPTAPTLPPTIAEVENQSPLEAYMNDVFTVPASLAGLPAASVPVGLAKDEMNGMATGDVDSIGLQVIGQFGADELVLNTSKLIENL